MARLLFAWLCLSGLAACSAQVGSAPQLISAQSPPNPNARNSQPQPPNSLPRGAQGVGNSGPNTTAPAYGTITFPL